jgi:MFS family permease
VLGLIFAITLKDRVLTVKPARPFDAKEFFGAFVFNPKTHSSLGWAWLTKAMIMSGYIGVVAFLTLYLATNFGMNKNEQAAFNGEAQTISVVFMVIFSIVGGRLSDRFARRRIFVTVAGIVAGVGILLVASASLVGAGGLPIILVGMGVLGIGMGLFFAVDQAMCLDVLPNPQEAAKDLGVLNIANTLPGLLIPLLAGSVLLPIGRALFGNGYVLLFAFVAVAAIAGGALVFKIKGVK